MDPIKARFSIPERDYLAYARKHGGELREGDTAVFRLILADGSTHTQQGKFSFLDSRVDTRTGTILMDVDFPNPGGLLRPGQFARAESDVETKKDALLDPLRAVQETQGVDSVLVVQPDDTVEAGRAPP